MARGFLLNRSRILPHARPRPIFRPLDQPCLDRVQVNVLDFIVVFLDGAQGTVEKPSLPQFAALGAPPIDEDGREKPRTSTSEVHATNLVDFMTCEMVSG